jgi:large subunit ribosomal protein L7/L12
MMTPEQLADELVQLPITGVQELKDILQNKYGLKLEAPVVVEKEIVEVKAEVKSMFDVMLKKDKLDETPVKMAVIRLVKEITGQTLQESKSLVESAPIVIKEGLSYVDAESIKDHLTAAGATIELI